MISRLALAACLIGVVPAAAGGIGPNSQRMTPVVRAVQRVRPAVVNIHSQKNAAPRALPGALASSGRMSGMGTGVIVDPRGYIVTNHHVIEDVANLRVTLLDGASYPATIIARDPQTDLALLYVKAPAPLPVMPMGASDDMLVGETVIAVGNAYGYEHTTTVGHVSELHRDVKLSDDQSYYHLVQTDAAINPGNSGGPLVNLDGEMIGLNVAIRAGAQNIGFAIPVDDVKQVLAQLMSVQRLRRTWHGLAVRNAATTDTARGRVVVRRVDAGSPAAAAGLQAGDRLLSVNGIAVESGYDIERALLEKSPGETVKATFVRGAAERESSLVVAAAPARRNLDPRGVAWRRLGARLDESAEAVQAVSTANVSGGLLVREIVPNGPADVAGIKAGDVLFGLHDRETLTLDNAQYMLRQPATNLASPVKFWIVRKGAASWGMIDPLPEE